MDCVSSRICPKKANPSKYGDAKPWVYHHESGHDRQVAEDNSEELFGIIRPA